MQHHYSKLHATKQLMKWLVHNEQGSSTVWVETNHTMDILHHTHTHTIKLVRLEQNRDKTGYGRVPSVYGWGQCGRGPEDSAWMGTVWAEMTTVS